MRELLNSHGSYQLPPQRVRKLISIRYFSLCEFCHDNTRVQIQILSANDHFYLARGAIQLYRLAKK